jgi:ferritin-like metal-binding protein YciE
MAKSKTLRELLVTKVQVLYDIETQLVEALPTMAEAATDPDLKEAFREHLDETRGHVSRIENIFDLLGEDKEKLESDAIRGLIKDGEWSIKNVEEGDALDTALIGAAMSVEHFEMAKYISAQEWAEMLGEDEISDILTETFEEEENASEKLGELGTEIAARVNENEDEKEED